ncbi:MAG: carboxypeptidase-like regulatory domain-containing protein, partial [Bacteroidota bacterium]
KLPRREASVRALPAAWQRLAVAVALLVAFAGILWYLPPNRLGNGTTAMEMAPESKAEAMLEESADMVVMQEMPTILEGEAQEEYATKPAVETDPVSSSYAPEPSLAERESLSSSRSQPSPMASSDRSNQGATEESLRSEISPNSAIDQPISTFRPEPLAESMDESTDIAARSRRQAELPTQAMAEGDMIAEDEPMTMMSASDLEDLLAESPNTVLIEGFVTDPDGELISNATVRTSSLPLGEITNGFGFFSFESNESVSSIIIEAPGYESSEFRLPQVENTPGNPLSPRPTRKLTREEAFARGLRQGDPGTVDAPLYTLEPRTEASNQPSDIPYLNEPASVVTIEGGMSAFRKRIVENKPARINTGRVRVSLTIQPDGQITELGTRGGNRELRQYVEGYIRNQTSWKMIQGDEATELEFELRF